jgi:hypothetical protein
MQSLLTPRAIKELGWVAQEKYPDMEAKNVNTMSARNSLHSKGEFTGTLLSPNFKGFPSDPTKNKSELVEIKVPVPLWVEVRSFIEECSKRIFDQRLFTEYYLPYLIAFLPVIYVSVTSVIQLYGVARWIWR